MSTRFHLMRTHINGMKSPSEWGWNLKSSEEFGLEHKISSYTLASFWTWDKVSLTSEYPYSLNMEPQEQDHFIQEDDPWILQHVKESEAENVLCFIVIIPCSLSWKCLHLEFHNISTREERKTTSQGLTWERKSGKWMSPRSTICLLKRESGFLAPGKL